MEIVRRLGKYIIPYSSKGTFVERDVFNHQKRNRIPLIETTISRGILPALQTIYPNLQSGVGGQFSRLIVGNKSPHIIKFPLYLMAPSAL
jgi:hypothetical protein